MTAVIASNVRIAHRSNARGVSWGRYALVGLATIIAANVANLIVYALGGALVAYDPQFLPLATPGGTVFFTVIPAVSAALLYAPIRRFARRPALVFGIVAALALSASIVPDLTYIPTVPGATVGQTAILILMHFAAAGVITGMLTRLNAPRER